MTLPGNIGRVQKHEMKRLGADSAVEETSDAHAMETALGFLRPVFVQLHAVSEAVVPVGDLPQSLAAPATGVKDVCGLALRETDSAQNQVNVVGVGGVIAHANLIHQPSDYRRVHRVLRFGELRREIQQSFTGGLVMPIKG